ncbi:MAG: hypothetical protein ACK559_10260 [bacterium]
MARARARSGGRPTCAGKAWMWSSTRLTSAIGAESAEEASSTISWRIGSGSRSEGSNRCARGPAPRRRRRSGSSSDTGHQGAG